MVKVENLSYYVNDKEILKDINVEFKEGMFTCIIGPNGCGKSTLAKIITKNINDFQGKVSYNSKDIKKINHKDFSKMVAFMNQFNNKVEGLSVKDFVMLGVEVLDKNIDYNERVDKIMTDLKIDTDPNAELINLSGGELQRVFLALNLVKDPKVLILDEPTNHLDIYFQYNILNILKELNIKNNLTVICIIHDINQACKYSDNICVLKDGQVYDSGKPNDVISKKTIRDVFNMECEIHNYNNQLHIDFIV